MKKYVSFLLFMAVIAGCSQQPTTFTIHGQIEGIPDSSMVFLRYADGASEEVLIDSITIAQEAFTFTGPLTTPRLMELVFRDTTSGWGTDRVVQVFAEPGVIEVASVYDSIRTERQQFSSKIPSSATRISGSEIHARYLAYLASKEAVDQRRSDAFSDYIAYLNPGQGKSKAPYDVGIGLVRHIDRASEDRKAFMLQYVDSLAPAPLAALAATQALEYSDMHVTDIRQMEAAFADADTSVALTANFLEKARAATHTATGSRLVDFTLVDSTGTTHRLSDYIGQGRYVLLEFWASWCGPCRADFPHLREVYDLYHDKGFDVIGVSLDENKADWIKAMDEENLSWLQLHEADAFKSELATTYRIRGIPACLLFDPDGNLVTRNMRGSWMDAILIDLYGDLFVQKGAM